MRVERAVTRSVGVPSNTTRPPSWLAHRVRRSPLLRHVDCQLQPLSFATGEHRKRLADGEGGSRFLFTIPAEPGWGESLAGVTLSGPDGAATLDAETDRPVAIIRNRVHGRVIAILRGAPTGALAQASVASLVSDPDSEVLFSRGIPDREAWRR